MYKVMLEVILLIKASDFSMYYMKSDVFIVYSYIEFVNLIVG